MKATKLIKRLERLIKKHGDNEITIYSDAAEQAERIGGLSICTEDDFDSKVVEYNICGVETQDGFMDNAAEAVEA